MNGLNVFDFMESIVLSWCNSYLCSGCRFRFVECTFHEHGHGIFISRMYRFISQIKENV